MHRAHATSIPFENFDAFGGHAVSLELADLEKLVARRRGGYCFEHNLLFMAALGSLGFEQVEPMLARVRRDANGDVGPLDHLVLRVTVGGERWLADVGFGGTGLLDPIPFQVGVESEQSGWRYRLGAEGPFVVLQGFQDDAWTDMYRIVPTPVPHVDIEVSNWFVASHPSSPFVAGVVAGMREVDRMLSFHQFSEPTLIERVPDAPQVTTALDPADVPALFGERLGLPGVVMADGRPGFEHA